MTYLDFLLRNARWGKTEKGNQTEDAIRFLQANIGALEQEISWLQKVKEACPDLCISFAKYSRMYSAVSVLKIATDCDFSWDYDVHEVFKYEYIHPYIIVDDKKIYSNKWGYRLGLRNDYDEIEPDRNWESILIAENIPSHLIQKTREYLADNVGPDPDEDWEAVFFPVRKDD
jgi:hypothetical protein